MLSPAQIEARDGKLTASRVACLMTGDEAEIMNLWLELVGDPAWEREDLSGVWAVQLGSHTEALNLDWHEKKTGKKVIRRGEVVVHPELEWAACTLDGWVEEGYCVEAKHVGGREPINVIIDRYQPQLQWTMFVTGARKAAISIIMGASEPIVEYIDRDDQYIEEMVKRAKAFMHHVWNLTPPVALPSVASPVRPEKTYDMQGSNAWAADAVTWLSTKQARKDCEAAEKSLKGLVPADAVRCHGYGVVITRDRAGRLSLREKAS